MLTIDDFKLLTLESKKDFKAHFQKYPVFHSEKLFTTMISWMEHTKYMYTIVDENLLTASEADGQYFFRIPHGNHDPDTLRDLIELAQREGGHRPLVAVEEEEIEWVSEHYPKIKYTPNPAYYDYVYLASDLADLKGGDYAKIRSRINKFKRNYNYALEDISEDNFSDTIEFLERWCQWKNCAGEPLLEHESEAIKFSFNHLFELEMKGLALRIDGTIQAVSVYEAMNSDTAVIHYEKAIPDFDGIYQVINQETAKILVDEFEFMNRQSDLGKPGLREAKTRYRPHHMVEVSFVNKSDLVI